MHHDGVDKQPVTPPKFHYEWLGGELSCGELLLKLKGVMEENLQPGQIIKMVTGDPGAFIDVPAWCGLTGHELMLRDGHDYYIRFLPHTKGA
ncbi:sulfurtransferase TusA family protein [Corynebacterium renale]|uniref:tRNA 2-thiouridine synthesizing protein A n=1 Tax=Corynebacterium renale TaxID=1724 RepID=A0A2A9DQY3_9CORY|nr:sulfurtransferase TusA family protein [Corynebacterium renale]PFG29003.1 tRNA 2-thiouridine synthesizing protein A [Corynebacterium renale]SQI25438.1 SirA-like protein [Corynebacterium renale]